MAPIAARHLRQVVDHSARVVALELLCACRALEFRRRSPPGAAPSGSTARCGAGAGARGRPADLRGRARRGALGAVARPGALADEVLPT
jgi:hypothetical protein